jgi:ribosomal protein S18 acetylase RimI-like enzyme
MAFRFHFPLWPLKGFAMKFLTLRNDYKRFGIVKTLYDALYRSINVICVFQILEGMMLTEERLKTVDVLKNADMTIEWLGDDRLRRFSNDPTNELTPAFLDKALDKGDCCLAVLEGDKLASYSWYSNKPTRIDHNIDFVFPPSWMYMYKSFTRAEYRGLHLNAACMRQATHDFTAQNFEGLLCFVESNNFSSLKSVSRIGFETFGSVYVLGGFNRLASFSSPSLENHHFHIETRDDPAPEPRPVII